MSHRNHSNLNWSKSTLVSESYFEPENSKNFIQIVKCTNPCKLLYARNCTFVPNLKCTKRESYLECSKISSKVKFWTRSNRKCSSLIDLEFDCSSDTSGIRMSSYYLDVELGFRGRVWDDLVRRANRKGPCGHPESAPSF